MTTIRMKNISGERVRVAALGIDAQPGEVIEINAALALRSKVSGFGNNPNAWKSNVSTLQSLSGDRFEPADAESWRLYNECGIEDLIEQRELRQRDLERMEHEMGEHKPVDSSSFGPVVRQ